MAGVGAVGRVGRIGSPAVRTGGGAARWGDGPAPSGFHWEFVFDDVDGSMVRDDVSHEPVVGLMEN